MTVDGRRYEVRCAGSRTPVSPENLVAGAREEQKRAEERASLCPTSSWYEAHLARFHASVAAKRALQLSAALAATHASAICARGEAS